MKLQRTTLILLLLALGLGGFVYLYEIRGATVRQEMKEKEQQIFSFTADEVEALTVNSQNTTISLERNNSSNSSDPVRWLLKFPEQSPANNASVSYLMDLLVDGKANRTLSVPLNQASEYGLNQPQATIEIQLKNKKSHKLILGKPDFNRRFLYAQIDPSTKPDGSVDVLLVSTDFGNAVNRQISEWKQLPENKEIKSDTISPESTPLPNTLPIPQNQKGKPSQDLPKSNPLPTPKPSILPSPATKN
jgi:Domain of unknown function (DUF4340)